MHFYFTDDLTIESSDTRPVPLLDEFKKLRKRNKILFTVLVGLAVILFWGGVWGLADELITPDNYTLSSLISLAVGIIIMTLLGASLERIA